MLFGEEVSGKFTAKWPTLYKPRMRTDCKNLHVEDLRSAQEESDWGWDGDVVAAILLLVHLLPPSNHQRKTGKIDATEAAGHVVKFIKV